MTPEPTLLNCAPMVQTDHKAKRRALYCVKHGTVVVERSLSEEWPLGIIRHLWRNRDFKDR